MTDTLSPVSSSFHHVVFPDRFAFGSTGGAEFLTDLTETGSGFEHRNSPWATARRKYNLTTGPRRLSEIQILNRFFQARRGRLHGFLFSDWLDNSTAIGGQTISAFDEPLQGVDGDPKRFQFYKNYATDGEIVRRRIYKLNANTVQVAQDGRPLTLDVDYTLDVERGEITLISDVNATSKLTAGFQFYVPVRFDSDQLDVQLVSFDTALLQSVSLVEIRIS